MRRNPLFTESGKPSWKCSWTESTRFRRHTSNRPRKNLRSSSTPACIALLLLLLNSSSKNSFFGFPPSFFAHSFLLNCFLLSRYILFLITLHYFTIKRICFFIHTSSCIHSIRENLSFVVVHSEDNTKKLSVNFYDHGLKSNEVEAYAHKHTTFLLSFC